MLKVENITLGYSERNIVKNIHFSLPKGEIVTIVGPNGCGKSTVLKAISRGLKPKKGYVLLEGRDIVKMDTREIAKKMAILPQSPGIPEDFTVRELVSYGRYPHLGWSGRMDKADTEAVDWAIEMTKIYHLQHRMVSTLSGGERQRAWIALALAQQPEILLLDEPTTFLDICYQFEVLELIKRLNRQLNLSIVMVLHDLNQAARYSDRIIALKDGGIYKEGKPREVITCDVLKQVFHIRVKVFEDHVHHCPYFIPLSSAELDGYRNPYQTKR